MEPNYKQYLKLPEWTNLEAVCLLTGVCPAYYMEQLPRIFHENPLSYYYPCPPRIEELQRFMRPVWHAIELSETNAIIPKDIISWAISEGFNIPDELSEFIKHSRPAAVKGEIKKRGDGYREKDDDFKKWIEENPTFETMKKAEIHDKLKIRNRRLWQSGFADWWKRQNIYKAKPGRKPG